MQLFNKLYKPSASKNGSWNLLKTLLQTSIFWMVFLWILPKLIVTLENDTLETSFEPRKMLGWLLFTGYSILGLWSGYTMSWYGNGTPLPLDCPQKLVIKGPYKYVRNPMAVAGIGQGIAVGIILGSTLVIIYALSGAFLWHFLVKPSEEADLLTRFGKDYQEYQRKVKCWLPRIRS
jgi:protein-S-isoprenylcysteine O-methyltransferase Ste14